MTEENARALHRLAQIDLALSRNDSAIRHGHFRSAVDDELDARQRRVLPREDQVGREATTLVLLFVRQLFAGHSTLTWKGDNGQTADDSNITIESVFSTKDVDLEKPLIRVRPGPTSSQSVAVGNLKHHDVFATGSKTISYVDVGTMQLLVHARFASLAQDLVDFLKKALQMPDCPLLHRGFMRLENVAGAGYDQDNPTYNRGTEKKTHVVMPVTFTYYWQTTMRSQPRENEYEAATALAAFLGVRDGPLEAPFVDGRRDSVLESNGTRVMIPLDPEQE